MAVGNNNGTYVPAHLRAAVEAPGFEEAARALRWDAPQAAVRPQPNERSSREREERVQAQKTIENGLSSIRMALANPNLSDAQRAELSQQQSQLEGLQTQLTTGARSVDVAHVSAVAAQVSSSVSATVASVGMGSTYSSAGVMHIQSSQQMVQLQQNLYQNDAIFRAQTDRVMGEAAQGRREVDALGRTTRTLESRLGIDTTESDRRLEEIRRQRDAAPDAMGKLRGDAAEAGLVDERAQRALAEARRQGVGVAEAEENARKTAEAKRAADDRVRQQQQNLEQGVQRDQSLTPEQRNQQLSAIQQGNRAQRTELAGLSVRDTNRTAEVQRDINRRVLDDRQGGVGTSVTLRSNTSNSTAQDRAFAFSGDFISEPNSAGATTATAPTPATAQQIASSEQVREVAKAAAAANVASSGDANHEDKPKPRQVAEAAPAPNNGGRSGRA